MPTAALKTASVLAFERKLDPSDALFSSTCWADRENASAWQPLAVREKSVRGTISNRLKTKDQDPAKLDAAVENPNLQTVDVATLPSDADTLQVSFTLRVLAGMGTPSACNNADYRVRLGAIVESYVQANGFNELAHRYATNLANGRFLWRNRLGAERVEVQIAQLVDGVPDRCWAFDAFSMKLREFTAPATAGSDLADLAHLISEGLGACRTFGVSPLFSTTVIF